MYFRFVDFAYLSDNSIKHVLGNRGRAQSKLRSLLITESIGCINPIPFVRSIGKSYLHYFPRTGFEVGWPACLGLPIAYSWK